jgi:hypothetical protein
MKDQADAAGLLTKNHTFTFRILQASQALRSLVLRSIDEQIAEMTTPRTIRKVKVWFFCHDMRENTNFHASVIPVGHLVGRALYLQVPAFVF